ncbi:hypothetical protein A2154_05045 [Candidatus Gottesmanbacteria bacterium RBG_16_43_7]|uniref:Rieske domain-containing protein n=1 Tax=Candidatus Gottesmanbacteria bacterium RBG_16_43_7 TaxID=1798373 RepID=A0A1F5Z843_9BACT|nr:MAG: hypothetical protein A2154_05045 [Candidatus Gottesmanbacteria bacterium RBG_16_43_7]
MAHKTRIMSLNEIQNNEMRTVMVNNRPLLIARTHDRVYVTDDTCSHHQCSLGTEGFLEGDCVICGCHGAKFDLVSGQALALPATEPVQTYKTVLEGDDIFVYI